MTSESSTVENDQSVSKTVIFVNGTKQTLDADTARVADLISLGGGQPGDYELQKRNGERGPVETTYTDPNQVIGLKNGDHFTTRFTGPINPA